MSENPEKNTDGTKFFSISENMWYNFMDKGIFCCMRIGIVDADLVGRRNHRFPNLACEKISAYWKEKGAEVSLLLNYEHLNEFDEVFISKVFTDTTVPENLCESTIVHMGGTGFFFDKAPNLQDEIEHHMPDYHLYDDWINSEILRSKSEYKQLGKILNMSSYMQQFNAMFAEVIDK